MVIGVWKFGNPIEQQKHKWQFVKFLCDQHVETTNRMHFVILKSLYGRWKYITLIVSKTLFLKQTKRMKYLKFTIWMAPSVVQYECTTIKHRRQSKCNFAHDRLDPKYVIDFQPPEQIAEAGKYIGIYVKNNLMYSDADVNAWERIRLTFTAWYQNQIWLHVNCLDLSFDF